MRCPHINAQYMQLRTSAAERYSALEPGLVDVYTDRANWCGVCVFVLSSPEFIDFVMFGMYVCDQTPVNDRYSRYSRHNSNYCCLAAHIVNWRLNAERASKMNGNGIAATKWFDLDCIGESTLL